MISTGSIYYDEIHRRANYDVWLKMLQQGDVTFEQWKEHWLRTATAWHDELVKEGLHNTCNHVWAIIQANK